MHEEGGLGRHHDQHTTGLCGDHVRQIAVVSGEGHVGLDRVDEDERAEPKTHDPGEAGRTRPRLGKVDQSACAEQDER